MNTLWLFVSSPFPHLFIINRSRTLRGSYVTMVKQTFFVKFDIPDIIHTGNVGNKPV